MTKCYWAINEGAEDTKPFYNQPELLRTSPIFTNQGGLSRAAIFNQIDASLRRLQTDYIDLYQIQRFDYDTPMEETMEALHDLVKMGKVRYIGVSSMWTWQFAQMNHIAEMKGWTKFVSMQSEYSLLMREEVQYFPFAEGTGFCTYQYFK